ncbi:MAG: hypothetical protein QW734_03875 [Candidatus Bathyarchaeia archaeon]
MTPEEYFKEFVNVERKPYAPTPPASIIEKVYYPIYKQNLYIPLIIAIISLALVAIILAIKK